MNRHSSIAPSVTLDKHVRAGKVYRRENLLLFSTSVDRDLQRLVAAGTLRKLAQGLYYKPQKNVFGEVSPEERVSTWQNQQPALATTQSH